MYLVDDHIIVREALASLLEACGHVVVGQAEDPTLALAEIRERDPDVLVLDLRLGPRSGFELLAEVQRRGLRVRTIVTTMSAQSRDVAESVRLGASAYLLKDSPGSELMQAIGAVMAGQRYFQGRVAELAVQGLSSADEDNQLHSLSVRERQVILLVVNGKTSAEIGAVLHLSPKTVDSYRSRLMAKVGVRDVQGLVRFALRAGLISADEI